MDLRDFIKKCEAEGELKRIKAEVDWDLNIVHTILYHRPGRERAHSRSLRVHSQNNGKMGRMG